MAAQPSPCPPTYLEEAVLITLTLIYLAEAALVAAVPDDNAVLLALQLGTGVAAGAGAVVLAGTAFLFSLLQGDDIA